MLARAVGATVESDMKALLDQMFSAGLSPELTSALKILAREIPNLHRDIQGGCGYNYIEALFAASFGGRGLRAHTL